MAEIYIKNIDAMESAANKLLKDIGKAKQDLLFSQAKIVRDAIRAQAPQGATGNLKRSPYAKSLPETTVYPVIAFAGIRPKIAPHAHLVEFGHGGPHPAPPHPFVGPAWESVQGQVLGNIRDGLKKTIENRS